MKNILFAIFFLLSLQSIAEDGYYVTVIGGEVMRQDRTKLKIGDKIAHKETIIFTSKNDFVIVLNPTGRYEISLHTNKTGHVNELISLIVKDNIHLHADNTRLSSRATGDEIKLADYFKPVVVNGKLVNEKILIAEELKIPIRNMGYSTVDNKESFFFLQLIDPQQHGKNKKLVVRNDSLLISKGDFIFNNKLYSAVDGILKLAFVEGYSKEKKISVIADIKPVFISTMELNEIVRAVILSLPNLPRNEVLNEIYTQLYYLYGKPDMELIEHIYTNQTR